MKIVTGYRGEPHITSEQDRAKNQGIFGEGSYVLDVGTKLRADLESGNEIRIHDGVISHQGCVAVIEKGAYDSLILSNGTQGRQRIDLIVARYEKDVETEVESLDLYVIEGTPATSDPQVPAYQNGDIQAGDILVEMPLYTVLLDGVQVSTITSVHKDLSNDDNLLESTRFLANTKVNRAGDTMRGNLTISKGSGDTGFYAERSDVGVKVSLEVGSSGMNHGVYSYKQRKWILYATDTDIFVGVVKVTTAADARSSIAAVYKAGDTMTGNLVVDRSGTTYDAVVEAKRGGRVQLCSNGANDRHGVYSPTLGKWLTRVDGSDIFAGSINVTSAADARTSLGLVTAYDNVNSNMFKYKTYSYQTNVSAGTEKVTITGTNLKVSTPSGYVPLAFRKVDITNNGETALCFMDASATGSSAVIKINNPNGLGYSLSVSVTIIYVKSGLISAG